MPSLVGMGTIFSFGAGLECESGPGLNPQPWADTSARPLGVLCHLACHCHFNGADMQSVSGRSAWLWKTREIKKLQVGWKQMTTDGEKFVSD